MATSSSKTTEVESKKRNEIRMLDVPDKLHKKISKNAKKNHRKIGAEALAFLEENYK